MNPNTWFNAKRLRRLQELMTRWRDARDRQEPLPTEEQEELDALVAAELQAASNRAAKLVRDLGL